MEVKVVSNILKANELIAEANRQVFERAGIYALNLMSSPGAGKTTLLEALAEELGSEIRMAVIEGDIATAADSERIAAKGVPTVQINTGGGCHLEAGMVARALDSLPLSELDLIIIENVGNLVCPADFSLGEQDKALILSVSEGSDKPKKYPAMFRRSSFLVINKIDLLDRCNFNLEKAVSDARSIQPNLDIFPLSATKREGLAPLIDWLRQKVESIKGRR